MKLDQYDIPELQSHKVTYGDGGGQHSETIYVVTPDDWNDDHEGFIGYMLTYGIERQHYSYFQNEPQKFVFDGQLYTFKVTEAEVEEIIGEDLLTQHKNMMKGIEIIMNHDYCKQRINEAEEDKQQIMWSQAEGYELEEAEREEEEEEQD